MSSKWTLHIPLIDLKPRYDRRKDKMVKQSPWLTLNDRDSWHRRKKLTSYYRDTGFKVAQENQMPFIAEAHIEYWMSYGNNRRLDPANYMLTAKAVIDGFVDWGMLVDDSSKYLTGPDPRRDESLPVGLTMRIFRIGM